MNKQELIEIAKRRIGYDGGYTPEHMGLSDDGRALPVEQAMPGGGLVVDREGLKAQSEGDAADVYSPFAPERAAVDLQREAARQTAAEAQKQAEREAKKHPEAGQQDGDSGNGV